MQFGDFISYRIEAARRALFARPADEWNIKMSESGFVLTHSSFRGFFQKAVVVVAVDWLEVQSVFAGQTDNLTWDTVWLNFVLKDGSTCAMPETAQGWSTLVNVLPVHLASALRVQEWLPVVTRDAFNPNIVQLYASPPNNSFKPNTLRVSA